MFVIIEQIKNIILYYSESFNNCSWTTRSNDAMTFNDRNVAQERINEIQKLSYRNRNLIIKEN